MSLSPIYIADYSFDSGYETDKKPFMLPDKAFPVLENAYVYRGRVKKREGNQLLARLRRVLINQAVGNTDGSGVLFINTLYTLFSLESSAQIEPGSVQVIIGGQTFTEASPPNGTLSNGSGGTGTINYSTGILLIDTNPVLANTPATISFNYFPSLPVMGIWTRDLSTINDEQTIFFDTKYAYVFVGSGFQEWIPGTTWNGTDSDFFLAVNYRGIEPSDRLFFVTNFVNDANNPMRYSDGTTWTTFKPVIGSQQQQDSLGTALATSIAFTGSLTQLPIIKGTVVITVGDITFTDEKQDGTLTGFPDTNSGSINYATGVVNLSFNPALIEDETVSAEYNYGNQFLFQAQVLVPYYGRLLALNTWEGTSIGTSTNIFNRCRFSQIGSPIQIDAWRSDTFGKGGFIDAPTAESIIAAQFFKNTLIVFFERSTWQLRYVGEYGLPFIWERISSDFGSESTFSPILFDEGVMAVGDKAIVTSSGTNVSRIDEKIPDLVFTFRNANNGTKRVHGSRNFQKELAFWCYADSNSLEDGQYFPNKVLLANYQNQTFAILRDNITCFGTFQPNEGITWDSLDAFWDSYDIFWDDVDSQSKFPFIVSGNAQGFINYFLKDNVTQNDESLYISAINLLVSPIVVTSPNHNLLTGDLIYIENLNFLDISGNPLTTNLNNTILRVSFIDVNTFSISKWDTTTQGYNEAFSFTPDPLLAGYVGGGVISLLPKMTIQTKDFNPFQKQGAQLKISYVDLLTDATENSSISINLYINSAINQKANVEVGNQTLETSLPAPYYPDGLLSQYAWHRFFATSTGQYMRIEMTYNNDLMNDITTHQSSFVLNAMQLWMRPGSKNIFG